MLGLTLNVRHKPISEVFSAKPFKIISAFSLVSDRDLGAKVKARRHTLQYNRSLPALVRP